MANLTISQISVNDYPYGGTTATLRAYADRSYIAEDGTPVIRGTVGSTNGFSKAIPCTVAGTVLTIPSFTLPCTTDSSNPNARYVFVLFDSAGVKRDVFLFNDKTAYSMPGPDLLASPTTWELLNFYHLANIPIRDTNTYSKSQINNLLANLQTAPDATDLLKGKVKLSVAPVGDPTAVGDNDPRLVTIDATRAPYSVLNNGTAQSTTGLQTALTAAGTLVGSIAPYIGVRVAGNFKFNSGSLVIPQGVALVGAWLGPIGHTWIHDGASQPSALDGKGTVFQIDVGSGSSTGAFITMYGNSTLKGISFYYPSQSRTAVTPTLYPWTVFLGESQTQTHFDQTVENCEFINSYQAIRVRYGGRFRIRNVFGAPIFGLDVDKSYDVAWVDNCEFNAYAYSSVVSTPPADNWYKYMNQNGVGIKVGRADQLQITNPYILGYKKGIETVDTSAEGSLPGGTAWMTVKGGGSEGCLFGVYLNNAQVMGVRFSGYTVADSVDSSGGGLGYGFYTAAAFRGDLQITGCHIGAGTAPNYGLLLEGGGTVTVGGGTIFHAASVYNILSQPATAPAAVTLQVTGCTLKSSTLEAVKVTGYSTGLIDANNFVQKTSANAFTDSTQAGYTVQFGTGNRFGGDNITAFGKGSDIVGRIFNDSKALAIYGNLQVAATSSLNPAAAANIKGIVVGSTGYVGESLNAAYDGTNWQRLDPANEAWLILKEAKTDDTGLIYVRHVVAGANPIAWKDTARFGGGAAVASAATITPTGDLFHVTGTTTITSVDATGIGKGMTITIIFDGILTFTDGGNLKLAGNFVTSADDTITLKYDGVSWYEVCRSVN